MEGVDSPSGIAAGAPDRASVAIAFGAFLLAVADLPTVTSSPWTIEAAIGVVLGAFGLVVLVRTALRPSRQAPDLVWASRVALAFVAATGVATLGSARPVLSLVGNYDQWTGLVFFAVLAGAWALGSLVTERGRPQLETALIGAAVVNGVIALVQQFVGLQSTLPSYGDQPTGVLGNPVFLGALLAAAVALLGDRVRTDPRRWLLPAAVVVVALGVDGERLPALLAVAVLAAEVVVGYRRGHLKASLLYAVAATAGIVVGSVLASVAGGLGVVAHAASSQATETFGDRLELWRVALQALERRPLFGYGPDQFLGATNRLLPLSFFQPQPNVLYNDAHNFFVDVATMTGVVGLVLVVGWLLLAAYRRSGRLALFFAVILVFQLAEPLNVVTTPLAFLALGAARVVPRRSPVPSPKGPAEAVTRQAGERWSRPYRVALALCGLAGVLLAGTFVAGDVLYATAASQSSVSDQPAALVSARRAEALLAPWPQPARLLATIHQFLSFGGDVAEARRAVTWGRIAAERDPTNGESWAALAELEIGAKEYSAATTADRRALHYEPWSPVALNLMGFLDAHRGHDAASRHYYLESLAVEPGQPQVRAALDGKCTPPKDASGVIAILEHHACD
ncbi:MAG: O-antigen ligase family protein [Acidimicrobiales bacterium]